jgi:hypothetical protein
MGTLDKLGIGDWGFTLVIFVGRLYQQDLSSAIATGFKRKWSKFGQDKDMIFKNLSR